MYNMHCKPIPYLCRYLSQSYSLANILEIKARVQSLLSLLHDVRLYKTLLYDVRLYKDKRFNHLKRSIIFIKGIWKRLLEIPAGKNKGRWQIVSFDGKYTGELNVYVLRYKCIKEKQRIQQSGLFIWELNLTEICWKKIFKMSWFSKFISN